MAYGNLLDDGAAPVRTITLNRPTVLNALDRTTLEELLHVFSTLAATPSVRCVIVTGAGNKAFAAGADLAYMADIGPDDARAFADLGHHLGDVMETLHAPIIAAVNGFALGGGLELAMACDFIIAAAHARLGQPEVAVGVVPGFGGASRLARRIGVARARALLYTGDLLTATEAATWGLVNTVVDAADLLPRVHAIAATIASRAPLAVAAAKRTLRAAEDLPLTGALAFEREQFANLFATADQKEGMAAFLQKRPPRFQGR